MSLTVPKNHLFIYLYEISAWACTHSPYIHIYIYPYQLLMGTAICMHVHKTNENFAKSTGHPNSADTIAAESKKVKLLQNDSTRNSYIWKIIADWNYMCTIINFLVRWTCKICLLGEHATLAFCTMRDKSRETGSSFASYMDYWILPWKTRARTIYQDTGKFGTKASIVTIIRTHSGMVSKADGPTQRDLTDRSKISGFFNPEISVRAASKRLLTSFKVLLRNTDLQMNVVQRG